MNDQIEIMSVENIQSIISKFDLILDDNFNFIFDLINIINIAPNKFTYNHRIDLLRTQFIRLRKNKSIYMSDPKFNSAIILIYILYDVLFKIPDCSNTIIEIINREKYCFLNINIYFENVFNIYLLLIQNKLFPSANLLRNTICHNISYEKYLEIFLSKQNFNFKIYRTIKPLKIYRLIMRKNPDLKIF
jgi:hypothetical protein